MRVDVLTAVVGLGRALDAAGVSVSVERVQQTVRAMAALDPTRRSDVYWAARITLCATREDIARFDAVFDALFDGTAPVLRQRPATVLRSVPMTLAADGPDEPPAEEEEDEDGEESVLRAAASTTEVLRHRDIGTLDEEEREALRRALAALTLPGETRRSRRFTPARSGPVDACRTMREVLRGGEVATLARRRHRDRPRRVVLLVDVSGSMSAYADALLRFSHAARRRHAVPTEVFTIGTRLTRVTAALAPRDPQAAMTAVADAVPDISGGTRLGALVREFLDRWGQRGMARGAVVVVLSDGWERDDAALLGEQMARLSRLAHRVVWCNPRKGQPGYRPLAAGIAAALPHVDDFVEGHSLGALEELALVVTGSRKKEVARGA